MNIDLHSYIRDVPDFPYPGILFKDITPLIEHPEAFRAALDGLEALCKDRNIDKIVGVESRGFLFGAPLADRLGVGFVMARKKGKLPSKIISISYELEYGSNTIEMHRDSISQNDHVLLIDDVLATGGTSRAVCTLIEQLGGTVDALLFVLELGFLKGREHLNNREVLCLMEY